MGSLRRCLGERLQQLRRIRQLTQEQLAGLVDLDPKFVGSIERGEKGVSIQALERIMLALKIEPYELFLFSMRGPKTDERLREEMVLNLIRRSDKSVHPLLLDVASSILRWTQRRKK